MKVALKGFFFFKESLWLAHHNCFWNIGHSPIEAQRCFPFAPTLYSLYTWKFNFGQTNEKAQHALTMVPYFLILGVRQKIDFLIFIFNMFPSSSLEVLQVLKLFLKAFPLVPQFYPIWFAQSSIVMYINWKVGYWVSSYLELGGPKRCFHWENAQCSKRIADEPTMKIALSKNKKPNNYAHIHELINMNHTKDHISHQQLYQHFWSINRSTIVIPHLIIMWVPKFSMLLNKPICPLLLFIFVHTKLSQDKFVRWKTKLFATNNKYNVIEAQVFLHIFFVVK